MRTLSTLILAMLGVAALAQARTDAKTGKPRPRFYIAVAIALAAMATLIVIRHLKG